MSLEKLSLETLTHIDCLEAGKCQETEGFKGTEHEGLDMCEDGCVWFQPPRPQLKKKPKKKNHMKKRAIEVFFLCFAFLFLTVLLPLTLLVYILTGFFIPTFFFETVFGGEELTTGEEEF